MSSLTVYETGRALGAEVRGVDLKKPLTAEEAPVLRRTLFERGVLLFRDQDLTEEDQVRFTRYFGDPVPHVRKQREREIPEIFIISNVTEDGKPIGALGNDEIQFHSDLSYMPEPGTISILYAIEVPERGGDTTWASGYAAYDALDPALKARVATLSAVHRHPEEQQNPETPAVHPVVRPHPETGLDVLYVNPYFTRRIVELSEDESGALLATLFEQVCDPRFSWTHHWRPHDLVAWDNRSTMHRREAFDPQSRRIMKRTQIFGEAARSTAY